MPAPVYSVTLHHLSPDAKVSGLDYPDEQLLAVNIDQLRDLLYALVEVSSRLTIYEPATPEIRIKTDRDVFVVRPRYRRLCFVGWESILRGEDHSVAYILTTITGTAEPVKAVVAPKPERPSTLSSTLSNPPAAEGGVPEWIKITVMTVLSIGFISTAVWMMMRPPENLAPKFELLGDFESQSLLTQAAGEYETGTQEGDRRLVVDSDGTLHLAKFGPKHSITDESTHASRGAVSEGRKALVTSDPYVVTIKDVDHLVLYGNIYKRHIR